MTALLQKFNLTKFNLALASAVVILLFASVMHLYSLNSYPPGLDADAATDGLDTLKFPRYGIVLFYITINANTDPLFIYTATLSSWGIGARGLALRLPAAFYSILAFAMTYTAMTELARPEFDRPTRRHIALLAIAALATSQAIAFFNRMGLRFSTQEVVQMAAVWALAKAIRVQKYHWWMAAGLLAGLTQYTYPAARVLPLLFGLIFLIKTPWARWKEKNTWLMVGVYLLSALLALLPQFIWYAQHPDTFLSRAGQTGLQNNPLYEKLGFSGLLLDKFKKYFDILHNSWLGQYNQIKQPLFAPLFYYGVLLSLPVAIFQLRRRFTWVLIAGISVMVLPELIAGEREFPHELRLTGAYPFVAAFAAYGAAWGLSTLRKWPASQLLLTSVLVGAIVWTGATQADNFFRDEGGNWGLMKWGGNTWLKRIGAGVGNYVAASNQNILIPLRDYGRTPIKYLSANRAQNLQSALDAQGKLRITLGEAEIILPRNDETEQDWLGEATQWVLVQGDAAYLLPPSTDLTALLPTRTPNNLIFGAGIDSNIALGYRGTIALSQLQLAPSYQPQYKMQTCFQVGLCLSGVSYTQALLQPNQNLRVQLFWQVTKPISQEYIMFVRLLDREQRTIAQFTGYPFESAYHTYEWRTQETILSTHNFQLPAQLEAGVYSVEVGFYLPYDITRLKTTDGNDRAYFSHLKVGRPAVGLPSDLIKVNASFANEVELVGYKLTSAGQSNAPLRLTLWWRRLSPSTYNWVSFFHLTPHSDSTIISAQVDTPAGTVNYPATIWGEGELIEDQIELNGNFATSEYDLWVGLYSPITQERALVENSSRAVTDNRLLLFSVKINP